MLTQAEINELADITREEKALKARKEKLVAKVKAEMLASNTPKLPCPGGTITISTSQRASFKKNMKDPFVLLLTQKGLKSYCRCTLLFPQIYRRRYLSWT